MLVSQEGQWMGTGKRDREATLPLNDEQEDSTHHLLPQDTRCSFPEIFKLKFMIYVASLRFIQFSLSQTGIIIVARQRWVTPGRQGVVTPRSSWCGDSQVAKDW